MCTPALTKQRRPSLLAAAQSTGFKQTRPGVIWHWTLSRLIPKVPGLTRLVCSAQYAWTYLLPHHHIHSASEQNLLLCHHLPGPQLRQCGPCRRQASRHMRLQTSWTSASFARTVMTARPACLARPCSSAAAPPMLPGRSCTSEHQQWQSPRGRLQEELLPLACTLQDHHQQHR